MSAIRAILLVTLFVSNLTPPPAKALEKIPDKLVVLTFDDSVKSQYEIVRPILKKYGFGATFFVTEGFDFKTNKQDYMTWEQIAELHRDGFEIGNHTRDHLGINDETAPQLVEQLEGIRQRCLEHDIPAPTSFAWPGNAMSLNALATMREQGISFARRGGAPEFDYESGRGFAYEPGLDHPLLIPSAGDARPKWELDDFVRAVSQARFGKIAVLQFHGVPDRAHPWVHTTREQFEQYMHYLATHDYHVIAMRDLAKYVDPTVAPQSPRGVMEDRKNLLAAGKNGDNARTPMNDEELRFWLANMIVAHHFTPVEAAAATGLDVEEINASIERLKINELPPRSSDSLQILPYPGGRHPRIGFRDGAIRPQRETKLSIFAPWNCGGYVVADVPEAIWWEGINGRELLYLAHTHVPTKWDKEQKTLEPLEWQRDGDGWSVERVLPNGVAFGATAHPGSQETRFAARLTLWIRNGTNETLRGLLVQNCVMLAAAPGFDTLTTDNKVIHDPYVACHNAEGNRWIITAWQQCKRPWGNAPCPCMHSDPQFSDCEPGATQRLHGWLSFYEGTDIEGELKRIEQTGWHDGSPKR